MIHVIHEGNCIPEEYIFNENGGLLIPKKLLHQRYIEERDWGAELVAYYTASALHLDAYYRVNIARVLLDFGRFPGDTSKIDNHMTRFAINHPFSQVFSFQQKRTLLANYYDEISNRIEPILADKLIAIGIHSYDEKNHSDLRRPAISIIDRSHGHQQGIDIPIAMFDPLAPHELAEYTTDTILSSRIALTFEEAAIRVASNYPYSLPEGSVEVRSQIWSFFRYVQQEYEKRFPQPAGASEKTPRNATWDMLLDTNLRSTQSEAVRSYLHMYRKPPPGTDKFYQQAHLEYEKIAQFIHQKRDLLVEEYMQSSNRLSSICIEIRKDLLWKFDAGKPQRPRLKNAKKIGRVLAEAIKQYVTVDREAKAYSLSKRKIKVF